MPITPPRKAEPQVHFSCRIHIHPAHMPHSAFYPSIRFRNGAVNLDGDGGNDTEKGGLETAGGVDDAAKTTGSLYIAVDAPCSFEKASPHAVTLIDSSASSEEAQAVMPWWKRAAKKVRV